MKLLPWKREKREYTDTVVQALIDAAAGADTVSAAASAATEAAAALYQDAFAVAAIDPPVLTRQALAMAARAVLTTGNAVFLVDGERLAPVAAYDVTGTESAWRYRCTLPNPEGGSARLVDRAAGAVVHFRRSPSMAQPWHGRSPWEIATAGGRMLAQLERVLGDELSAQVGRLLPIPVDPSDESSALFKADLGKMRGRTLLVESTSTNWDRSGQFAKPEYRTARIGPEPPPPLTSLHGAVANLMVAACNVPIGLVVGQSGAPRELWRRFMHGAVAPLGALMAEELTIKLQRTVTITFDSLYAADVQGRARAYASLVKAGMDAQRAAELSGVQ